MTEFLKLKSADEARTLLGGFGPVGRERVPLAEADGRVVAEDLRAPEDLPPWPRSVMDGFAVRAKDTFGASDTVPAFLKVKGHVPMGDVFPGAIAPGETAGISTGGVLPEGTDAVVMIEFTQELGGGRGGEVEVRKGVAPGDHVIRVGEDVKRGEVVVPAGKRLRPQEIGALAAFGIVDVPVFRRPRVGILSTGNEVVPPEQAPRPGQVRCMNQFTLAAQARRCGADVRTAGIAPDEPEEIRRRTADLLGDSDMILLSGGSSVGVRDLTAGVLESLGARIIFHGISVRPGKPTILARLGDKPILGMPGVPVSAMVIFDVFLRPVLWALGGETGRDPWPARRRARLSRRIPSVAGREDYVRVALAGDRADPLPIGSAAVSTLTRADGIVLIPANVEGLGEDEDVEVLLYGT